MQELNKWRPVLKMLILNNKFHKSTFALFAKFVALEKGTLRYILEGVATIYSIPCIVI